MIFKWIRQYKIKKEFNRRRKVWTDMLRSGKYKQSNGRLQNSEGFCCLGVACLAYEYDTNIILHREYGRLSSTTLFHKYGQVAKWLNLSSKRGTYGDADGALTSDNDDNTKNFKQIADIIDSKPTVLFRKINT